MQIPAASVPQLPSTDDTLVPGLVLPRIDGLPGPESSGMTSSMVPAPPSPDSVAGKADLESVRLAQRLRTPAGNAWALKLAHDGSHRIWMDLAKRHRGDSGPIQGWLDTALLAATFAVNGIGTQAIKWRFRRERPFQVDPSITTVVPRPRDPSYPSGHTSSAYAAARVISVLAPSLAAEAYSLAKQVATSRVYAGVHFPTDVVMGAMLGTAAGEAVLRMMGRRPVLDAFSTQVA